MKKNEMRAVIMGCSDPLMWYANMVGKEISVIMDRGEFLSKESGFINIIHRADIEILPKCKHQDFFDKTFTNLGDDREYWIFTEVFSYLHSGSDYCNCHKGDDVNAVIKMDRKKIRKDKLVLKEDIIIPKGTVFNSCDGEVAEFVSDNYSSIIGHGKDGAMIAYITKSGFEDIVQTKQQTNE